MNPVKGYVMLLDTNANIVDPLAAPDNMSELSKPESKVAEGVEGDIGIVVE